MIIAIPYSHGQIDPHFGHAKQFKFYLVEDDKITFVRVLDSNCEGHAAISSFLKQCQVDTVIITNIGAGAKRALELAHIDIYNSENDNCDESVLELIKGNLKLLEESNCDCHEDGHNCGNCGENGGCGGCCH